MKRLLAVTLMAMSLYVTSGGTAEASCYSPNCWGAIAIGPRNGAWAYVTNWPTANIARQRVAVKCGGRCDRAITFRNGCGAYAIPSTRGGGYGWAIRYARSAAQQAALYNCRRTNPGRGCHVAVWACTSRTR